MEKLKRPFFFSLCMLAISLPAAVFMLQYQTELLPPEILEEITVKAGSRGILFAVGILQTEVFVLTAGFCGQLLADKLGVWKGFQIEKKPFLCTLILSSVCGILFSLDYWTFGAAVPQIREATKAGMTLSGVLASVLYGGIVEELLLRLFFLSLTVFCIWKLFFRRKEEVPAGIWVVSNLLAALLFAAGHLPVTIQIYGGLTPLIVFRCFLLNGGFGLVFGYFYHRWGIQYAMLGHLLCHLMSKLIWLIFI